jgi:hypothetical protein
MLELQKDGHRMSFLGRVQNGVVILQNATILPNDTLVEVRPFRDKAGTAAALIAVMEGEPHLSAEDIAALNESLAAGERPSPTINPFGNDSDKA